MYEQVYEHLKLDNEFPFAYFETSDRQAFLHYHDCLELNVVEEGGGYYIINGRKYNISKDDIFVINNKEPHMAVHGENFQLSVIVFDIDLLWRNKGISSCLTPFFNRKDEFSHQIKSVNKNHGEMTEIFKKICEEYNNREKGWQMAVESLLMYLLTLIYRCYDEMEELEETSDNFEKMYSRISVVMKYLAENFREEITLEQIASEVSLSRHYLCKCFKKITGKTIFEYIEQLRVQYSCYLLKTTDDSIMDVALLAGFNSVNYYNRVFKRIVKMTPGQYRKENINL